MNTYTHLGLEDAVDEMNRMQQLESARKEQEALSGKTDEVEAFEEAFPGRITGENDNTDWSDPAGFLLPGFSFYGILCQERNGSQGIPSSKPKRVLLLFCCF